MKERKKQIYCWRCKKQLRSLTNPDYEHQLCQDCIDDGYLIKRCLKCNKELLINKYRDGRTCEKPCRQSNASDSTPFAEEPEPNAWRRTALPDDSIFRMIHISPTNTR